MSACFDLCDQKMNNEFAANSHMDTILEETQQSMFQSFPMENS